MQQSGIVVKKIKLFFHFVDRSRIINLCIEFQAEKSHSIQANIERSVLVLLKSYDFNFVPRSNAA
jgi:hypothetical protein